MRLCAADGGEDIDVRVGADGVSEHGFQLHLLDDAGDGRGAAPAGEVVLRGEVDGARFELHTRATAMAEAPQRLACQPPGRATIEERRGAPRFPGPAGAGRVLAVVHIPGEVLLCDLVDISRLGLRLRLADAGARIGDAELLYCQLRHGERLLQLKIAVRWRATVHRHQEFGARLLLADKTVSEHADHFVREIERHWLRHRSRD